MLGRFKLDQNLRIDRQSQGHLGAHSSLCKCAHKYRDRAPNRVGHRGHDHDVRALRSTPFSDTKLFALPSSRRVIQAVTQVRRVAIAMLRPSYACFAFCLVSVACAGQPERVAEPAATWCGAGDGALHEGGAALLGGIMLGPAGLPLVMLAPVAAVYGAGKGASTNACPVTAHAMAMPADLAGLSRRDILERLGLPNAVSDERSVIVYHGPDAATGLLLIQFDPTGHVRRAERTRPRADEVRTRFAEYVRRWSDGEKDEPR